MAVPTPPDQAAPFVSLGYHLNKAGRHDEAVQAYRRALARDPDSYAAAHNLANLLARLGRWAEALPLCERAVRLRPAAADSYLTLGSTLRAMGRLAPAEQAFRRVIALQPGSAEAQSNLALLLAQMERGTEAVQWAAQAVAAKPNDAAVRSNYATLLRAVGRPGEAIAERRRAVALAPDLDLLHSNLLFDLSYDPGCTPAMQLAEAREWAARHAAPLAAAIPPHENPRGSDRRLRIGYVSPSFREHAVAFVLEPILAAHDHAAFEITCYSDVRQPDQVTRRFQTYADRWRPIVGRTHAQVAEMVRQDGIDILVDLAGHTADHRLLVFARKPAPVQVTYLDYPPTTGLPVMDYKLTDGHVDPPGEADRHYTETLVRLAPCAWCYRPSVMPEVVALPCQDSGQLTFGCLNRFDKVTPAMLDLWAAILQALPGSRLVIKVQDDAALRERVRNWLAQRGVAPERIELFGRQRREDYLRRCGQVDIALDTYPYNGHITSWDTLWMGTPIVTLAGATQLSRVGLSLLSNLGLGGLAADTPEAYVAAAVSLGRDRDRLGQIRASLRERLRQSGLSDASAFTRRLEDVYRWMWQRWCMPAGATGNGMPRGQSEFRTKLSTDSCRQTRHSV